MPQLAYVVMGSNIEPRKDYLNRGVDALKQQFPQGFLQSRWVQSSPYQGLDQAGYINGACRFFTELSAEELLRVLLDIEADLGRVRDETRWGDRTLDLDIALFGDQLIETKSLVVPHYDLAARDFFLVPLLELDPQLMNPRSGKSIAWHLEQIPPAARTDLFY